MLHLFYQMLYKSFFVNLYFFYLSYLYKSSFVNSIRPDLLCLSLWYLSFDVILCNHLLYLVFFFFLGVIV